MHSDDDRKGFRAALSKFLDIYSFLAQAIAFTDAKLEATFLYGRHLQNALRRAIADVAGAHRRNPTAPAGIN